MSIIFPLYVVKLKALGLKLIQAPLDTCFYEELWSGWLNPISGC